MSEEGIVAKQEASPAAGGGLSAAHREGLAAAQRYRLPFGRQSWRGQLGAWHGAGVGSSIDFQDHRAYMQGDDPRYIHWSAYARTGQLTMKLYRAEVSPMVDVVVDTSGSMVFDPMKARRMEALVAFCVASADRVGAPVRVLAVSGRSVQSVPVELVRAGRWRAKTEEIQRAERLKADGLKAEGRKDAGVAKEGDDAAKEIFSGMPGFLPWRPGALKVLVCDLLFPGDPASLLATMTAGGGLALIFAPGLAAEAEPPERGNVELVDCEGGRQRHQRIDDAVGERYREAYVRHFALWEEAARRRGVMLVRIRCEEALVDVLGREPCRLGAVEVCAR